MNRMLLISLAITASLAQAAESLNTPHGVLAFKSETNKDFAGHAYGVTLAGKKIGSITYGGYPDFKEKPYKLGGQDIYVFTSHSGAAGDPNNYHGLVVIEKGKGRVLEDFEFWATPADTIDIKTSEGVLSAELGVRDNKTYRMVYDGKNIAVKSEKVRSGTGKKGKSRRKLDKERCQSLHEFREDLCPYFDFKAAAYVERLINDAYERPGFNYDGLEQLCKKKDSLMKMSYADFQEKVCTK